jgi:hypothetical protein
MNFTAKRRDNQLAISGAGAARAAFRLGTLQVRILAAGQGRLVALTDTARRLGLGQALPRAAWI